MTIRQWLALGAASTITCSGPAAAQQPPARPELLSRLFDCRKIVEIAERVACYDRQVAALDEAERKQDVVVVDRAEIRRTRRSLFGLTLPRLKLFGNDDADAEQPEFTTIETTIRDAQQSGSRWLFTLDDGARWIQSDDVDLARKPAVGQHIRIRKAAMGSFLANIEKQLAIRVRRIN